MTKSRVYVIWKAMHQRCGNPNARSYLNYGGRGITICDRWNVFEDFLADMGEPPGNWSIERINNDGNYEPGNCRWASYKDQLNNRRTNHVLEAFGRRQTLTQWAEEYGMPVTTLSGRINRMKMPVEEALSIEDHR